MDEGERQRHWEKDRHPGDCEVHLRDRLTLDGFSYTIPLFWHLKLKTQSYYESPYGPDSPPLSILPWGLLRPCPPRFSLPSLQALAVLGLYTVCSSLLHL